MNEQELRSLVERMVLELAGQPNAAAPAKATPVTAAAAAGGCLDDITETDLRRQYLVKNPRNGPAFLDLKLRTPARWAWDGRAPAIRPYPCCACGPTTRRRRTRCFPTWTTPLRKKTALSLSRPCARTRTNT